MNRLALGLVLVTFTAAFTTAQTPEPPANEEGILRLRVVETKALQNSAGSKSIILPAKCDEGGNLYVRYYDSAQHLRTPVSKITPKGEQPTRFSIASDPDFQAKRAGVLDYTVGKNGELFQLAAGEKGYYVVEHNKDGSIKKNTRLETGFTPSKFEVFGSGEFLITGAERGTEEAPGHGIVTAIFDSSGKLLRRVALSGDKPFAEAASRGDSGFVQPGQITAGNFAVERGQVTRADDGNIYVVRWADPAKVYAIAPSGEVVRSFEVKPKWEGRKPDALFSHGSRLALEYAGLQDDPRWLIMVVGLEGQEIAAYDISKTGTSLACYGDGERFTLFNGSSLLFAEPQ